MTKFLRTASTRRLLATVGGLIAAVCVGTAIAVAAAGSGPVPPRKPLAQAIRQALAAPTVTGITARIKFTNHLIDASAIQGSDPILSGATGRLWLSNDHRLRLELQSDNGDAQVVVGDGSFWAYDPSANTVYEGTLPAAPAARNDQKRSEQHSLPSVAQIQSDINRLARRALISGAIPSNVAGRAAYTVRISPRQDAGLLGAAELAWDATRGVPLRIGVFARGQSAPVLELKATDISYGPVPASDFQVSPPAGAKVVKVATPAGAGSSANKHGAERANPTHVTGAAPVARRLRFKLVAPSSLAGLRRSGVTLLDWKGTPAALVTYGRNLGGIAVIEQLATAGGGQIAGPS